MSGGKPPNLEPGAPGARLQSMNIKSFSTLVSLALASMAVSAQVGSVDLSQYQLVGRHALPEPNFVPVAPGDSSLLAQEASGVAWNRATNSLFIIGDGSRSIVQVSLSGQLIDKMNMALVPANPQGTAFYDTEGITAVGNNQFIITEERLRRVSLVTYSAGSTLAYGGAPHITLLGGQPVNNEGLEGLSWDPSTNGIVVVKEINPSVVFQTTLDWANGTASNGSATATSVSALFNAATTGLADIADVFALSNLSGIGAGDQSNLLLLSQETGRIIEVDRQGNILSTLNMPALGNAANYSGPELAVADRQHEGLTMDDRGYLYVVNENGGGSINYPELWVFAPVPEVSSTTMLLAGLGITGLLARRRRSPKA
jgi:uncharacterized protein YjiK